jgi:hypothetical protein
VSNEMVNGISEKSFNILELELTLGDRSVLMFIVIVPVSTGSIIKVVSGLLLNIN